MHTLETTDLVQLLIDRMHEMVDEERLGIMQDINEQFCSHCGSYHGDRGRPCQCWNDERCQR